MRQSFRTNSLRVILAVLVAATTHVGALNITECSAVTEGQYITHTRPNCNYNLIFCNGQDSEFCDAVDLCQADYNCAEGSPNTPTPNPATFASSSTSTTTTVSTTTASPLDVRAHCRHGVTQKYRYPNNCNYYYYCMDGFLVVEMCPIGYAFSAPSGTCSGRVADVAACRGS